MESLPNELLIQIASQLDCEPPSIVKLAYEPSTQLTYSESTPLKFLSQVSWRWRKIVLPILFQYSRMPLDADPKWVPIDARLVESMAGQMTTLSSHEFQVYQRMRSKFKSSSMFAYKESFDELLINLCQVQEGDHFFKSVPHILWLPQLPKTFVQFEQFVKEQDLERHIKSIVVHTDKEYELRHVPTAEAPLTRAVSGIWTHIFNLLNPIRVVVAAPPNTLAGLLGSQMLNSDLWAFDMKTHYVELLREDKPWIEHTKANCRPWDRALIHRRPWYHLGYNEGSSISAYSTYEYHLKQTPMTLYLILARLAKEVQSCCNITSFSFTGVLPFATNIVPIVRALHRIPTLNNISVRLAPGPENNLLSDAKRLGRAQSSDFWLEWMESYKVLAHYLQRFPFKDGAEFTSLDCDRQELAGDVDVYMDMLREKGAGWRKEGRGRWVRDHGLDRVDATVQDVVV